MNSPQSPGKSSSPINVLVVDDEPLIRWSLKRGLAQRGHNIIEAADGAEALRRLKEEPQRFGIILLDYRLPDRQDLTLLRDIRRVSPESVVLMMTAHGDSDMRTEALALGARVVIQKPFQVKAVVTLVESPPPAQPVPDA